MNLIFKTRGAVYISYEQGLKDSLKLSTSNNSCILYGSIDKIILNNYGSNVSPINEIKIYIKKNNLEYIMKSLGVINNNYSSESDFPIGIIQPNGQKYIPQTGDNVLAIINPENTYIKELYKTEGKTQTEIDSEIETLKIPFCSGALISESQNFSLKNNSQNYFIFGGIFIVIFIVIVGFFLKKYFKNKEKN